MNCLCLLRELFCPQQNIDDNEIIKKFTELIDTISDRQYELIKYTKDDPFKFMQVLMDYTLLPFCIKNFNISEVSKYWIDRNFNNIKTEKILELELEKLKSIFNKKITKDFFEININEDDEINEKHIIDNFDYIKEIIPMSSLCAKLNLITESDIDFGLLIENLNEPYTNNLDLNKFNSVKEVLLRNGYRFSHSFNETDYKNRFFSFVKIIDETEIEIKVRDYETAKSLVSLHNILDTQLNEIQMKYYTYMKHLCKKIDKSNSKNKYYAKIKKIIYEAHWVDVPNAFVFPRVCNEYEKYTKA